MASRLTTAELVDRGDLDDLLRRIDDLCDAADWAGLLDVRDRCRAAFERGRQLWPAASHAEYRLALEAPGPWAAAVLTSGTGRFALGPLPEVAASGHTWEELAPHLESTPEAAMAAHERVVRGDDLRGDERVVDGVLELPLSLQPWEPAYATATYRAYEAEFPPPPAVALQATSLPRSGTPVDDPDAVAALVELAAAWKAESNGAVAAVAVEGDSGEAIAALAPEEARLAKVESGHALALMAWAAASGGAHGRRKGAAAGRFSAWWAVAALGGLLDEWPFASGEVGATAADLDWYRWEPPAAVTGWWLGLAAADRAEGKAWAVRASDAKS